MFFFKNMGKELENDYFIPIFFKKDISYLVWHKVYIGLHKS